MSTRSADATIRGYYYQFDKTILEILNASDSEAVVVERIEDIDIDSPSDSKAIQCKYIPSSKYLPSSIRPPIVLMLDNHAERLKAGDSLVKYHLYAHFSDEPLGKKANPVFTLDELKALLTYTEQKKQVIYHAEQGISDETLRKFLDQFSLEIGPTFQDQQAQVLGQIKKVLSCSDLDADLMFYNNALRVVRDLAVNPRVAERRITKADFLQRINVKRAVFHAWYLQLRGEESYCKLIRQKMKLADALGPLHLRMILMDAKYIDHPAQTLSFPLFMERLVSVYHKRGVSFSNVKPLTVVINGTQEQSKSIKRALLRAGIIYNDGHEDLEFQPWLFNEPPVVNKYVVGGKASSKLGKSSYQIRFLRAETYKAHVDDIDVPDKAILFTEDDPKLYFPDVEPFCIAAHAENLDSAFKILI